MQGVYDSDDSDNEKSISAKDVDDLALMNPHTDFFGVSEIKLDTKDVGIVNIRILLEQKNRDTAEKIRQVFELPFLDHYRGGAFISSTVCLQLHRIFVLAHQVGDVERTRFSDGSPRVFLCVPAPGPRNDFQVGLSGQKVEKEEAVPYFVVYHSGYFFKLLREFA